MLELLCLKTFEIPEVIFENHRVQYAYVVTETESINLLESLYQYDNIAMMRRPLYPGSVSEIPWLKFPFSNRSIDKEVVRFFIYKDPKKKGAHRLVKKNFKQLTPKDFANLFSQETDVPLEKMYIHYE